MLESCGPKLGYTRKHNKSGQQRRFCSNEVLKTEFTANIAAHGKQTTSTGKDYTQDFPSRSKRNLLPLCTGAHLEFDAMGEKEIKNVLELIVCRAAKNEARRQSRLRGSELAGPSQSVLGLAQTHRNRWVCANPSISPIAATVACLRPH